jgi:hypothetical protein
MGSSRKIPIYTLISQTSYHNLARTQWIERGTYLEYELVQNRNKTVLQVYDIKANMKKIYTDTTITETFTYYQRVKNHYKTLHFFQTDSRLVYDCLQSLMVLTKYNRV